MAGVPGDVMILFFVRAASLIGGASISAELAVSPGGIHGLNNMPLPLGVRASERIDAFIREATTS